MKGKLIYIMLIAFVAVSCRDKSTKQQESCAIGKYLYMDVFHRLHVKKDCKHIGDVVEFLDTAAVIAKDDYKYCKDCFTDSTYEHVQSIMNNDADRKWLYYKFVDANYEMSSYREFLHDLHNPQNVKSLYDAARKENWDVGSYEEFSKLIGFNGKEYE